MAREKKARKSNVAVPIPEKMATPEKVEKVVEAEMPETNGKKHVNGFLRNGKPRLSESEKPLGDREKEPST